MNYNNKFFISLGCGETSPLTNNSIFTFKQYSSLIQASFRGKEIKTGEIVGLIKPTGVIDCMINFQSYDGIIHSGNGTIFVNSSSNVCFQYTVISRMVPKEYKIQLHPLLFPTKTKLLKQLNKTKLRTS